jgi:hypothetical protein
MKTTEKLDFKLHPIEVAGYRGKWEIRMFGGPKIGWVTLTEKPFKTKKKATKSVSHLKQLAQYLWKQI